MLRKRSKGSVLRGWADDGLAGSGHRVMELESFALKARKSGLTDSERKNAEYDVFARVGRGLLNFRPMASLIREVGETALALIKGFSVTFKTMFEKTVTENYPAQPVNFQPRYRGIHVLHRDENDLEKCVGCFLCAAACPSNCIYIEAAENTDEARISAGERYAKIYNIDYSRCIFCGYCVEACPTDAITHGHGFELATYDINSLVYRKEQMLEGTGGKLPAGANA
jgi:NADH-quinone oxidoreductase subunit I